MKNRHGRRPGPVSTQEDVDRELRSHLALHVERLVAQGVPPEEAQRQAREAFGNYAAISSQCRHISEANSPQSLANMFDSIVADVRFAWRTLRKNPVFLATAVMTLALGIGANTAIFSVVNGILLSPLPYEEPDRIVALWERTPSGRDNSIATANFWDWQAQTEMFESMAVMSFSSSPTTVLGGEAPARVRTAAVSLDFFRTIGVQPRLGRTFGADEAVEGAPPKLVVAHSVWQDLLGAPADLAGQTLRMNGFEAEVVGVMPPGFNYPGRSQVWFPIELYGFNPHRTAHGYSAIARLLPEVPLEAAAEEIDAVGAALYEIYGDETDAVGVNVYPLHDELVGDARSPLILLLASSGMVLLVACGNLASSLLARGTQRLPETALRAALGARRGRLIRQAITEAVVLAVLGAVVGMLTAQFVTDALLRSAPGDVWRYASVELDPAVLGFTLIVALGTAFLFGLYPALRLTRSSEADALRGGSRTVAGGGTRIWSALVVAEVALVVVLLTGAGLMMRSFQAVLDIDAGFESTGVLTVDIDLPEENYADDGAVARFLDGALAELEALPGVDGVGLVSHLPLSGRGTNGQFDIEGREPGAGYSDYRVASPDYFETLSIPLVEGRFFEPGDQAGGEPVVVVNEALAREYFGDESAVGKRVGNLANDNWIYGEEWMRIVGVVGDVRHRSLTRAPAKTIYVHYRQRPLRARTPTITVRTTGDPVQLVNPVRNVFARLDTEIPTEITPMRDLVSASVRDRRFTAVVLSAFSVMALALAAVGIYGVVAYAVARRRRDIGIRLALGAEPGRIQHEIVRGSLLPTVIGLGIGVAASIALGRLVTGLVYGVGTADPMTFAGVAAILLATAFVACWLPARRTAKIDPMTTMRTD